MHLLVEETVVLRRSAHKVFGYVSNMEKFGEWFPGVISITSPDSLAHGQPGKTYRETVFVPLKGRRQITLEVREARAPHFFATEGRWLPLLPRMEISLEATAPHTCTLTWRMFSRSRHPGVRFLLVPLARVVMKRRAARGLAALKLRLEDGLQRDEERLGRSAEI